MADLLSESVKRGIKIPTQRTLDKYGLKVSDWLKLLQSQDWKCAVCHKSKAKWNTDHEHVQGWSKMTAERRSIYVRGVLCWYCNRHIVQSNLTHTEAQRIADYIGTYEKRRDARKP